MCSCACLSLRAVGLDSRCPEVQSVVTVGPCAHSGASWIHGVPWSWVYGFPGAAVTNGTHLVAFLGGSGGRIGGRSSHSPC